MKAVGKIPGNTIRKWIVGLLIVAVFVSVLFFKMPGLWTMITGTDYSQISMVTESGEYCAICAAWGDSSGTLQLDETTAPQVEAILQELPRMRWLWTDPPDFQNRETVLFIEGTSIRLYPSYLWHHGTCYTASGYADVYQQLLDFYNDHQN